VRVGDEPGQRRGDLEAAVVLPEVRRDAAAEPLRVPDELMATVLCPLPDTDFDTTEVAVPWKLLGEAGHRVVFATERADVKPACDPLLLSGVMFGALGAEPEPKAFYAEMIDSAELKTPIKWSEIDVTKFDALLLPGGHAPGMKQYLGSEELQRVIADFWKTKKPVAAICHGVLPLARAKVLAGKKTTCLPKYMERTAYMITAWKLGRYYRTYDAYVEDEVRAALRVPEDFVRGPRALTSRGTREDDSPAFVVEDGNYVSARWPGDAYLFAKKLIALL
jgi:putative intracellular protease/amidase